LDLDELDEELDEDEELELDDELESEEELEVESKLLLELCIVEELSEMECFFPRRPWRCRWRREDEEVLFEDDDQSEELLPLLELVLEVQLSSERLKAFSPLGR